MVIEKRLSNQARKACWWWINRAELSWFQENSKLCRATVQVHPRRDKHVRCVWCQYSVELLARGDCTSKRMLTRHSEKLQQTHHNSEEATRYGNRKSCKSASPSVKRLLMSMLQSQSAINECLLLLNETWPPRDSNWHLWIAHKSSGSDSKTHNLSNVTTSWAIGQNS